MTTVIIKSDSDKKTNLLIRFAEELGLQTITQDFKELDTQSVTFGIGRKASDTDMIDYLSRESGTEPIDIEIAFSKYLSAK